MILYIFLGLVSIWILINFIDAVSGKPVKASQKAASDWQKRSAETLRNFHRNSNVLAMKQLKHHPDEKHKV
jgi:hypothetical protein